MNHVMLKEGKPQPLSAGPRVKPANDGMEAWTDTTKHSRCRRGRDCPRPLMTESPFQPLQHEPAQIRVTGQLADPVGDVGRIDGDSLALLVGGLEAQLLDEALHDGLEPASADVLDARVDLHGRVGN